MLVVYGIQDYDRADLPRIRLNNLYAEQAPSSRSQTALLSRPGMTSYTNIGSGPIRGMFAEPGVVNGALFAVSGTQLYVNDNAVGTISGEERVTMTSSSSQVLIANDSTLRLSDGYMVEDVTFPDNAAVSSVAFINGYFLASRAGTQRFYWSAVLDGSSWDPLDYASAERAPDNIVALSVVSDQVWIFGEKTTEVWVPTGDGEIPFQRVEGRLYDQGCIARDTIAKLDNSIFWVGSDFKVYRGDTTPLRVSGHSIEQAVQASNVSDLKAWVYPFDGNLFYVLHTTSGSFQYNVASQQWSTVSSYGRSTWRAHVGLFYRGLTLAGDDELGRIWRLDRSVLKDGDDPIERVWTVLIPDPMLIHNVVLDVSTGEAALGQPEQMCEFQVSRDSGNTFGDWREMSLGTTGQYRRRAVARRIGMIDGDGGVFAFRMTDPSFFRVSSVRMNEALGGRSR
jgi:hypothetical protein